MAPRFGGALTIGDIARGRAKAVVDCLRPHLGSAPGSPDDRRITALQVEKARTGVAVGAVEITVHAVP